MDREKMIGKFIEGSLTETEQKEFDRLYAVDASFKTEVDFHTNIARVAEAEDDDTFREMLSSFEAEAKSEKTTVKRLPTKWLVAASIVLIAGLSYFFIPDSTTSSQELFSQNFERYPNVVYPIVRGEEGPEPKTKAFLAYQNGEYTAAVALFTELYTNQAEPDFLFYKANALLQLDRGQEAIPVLKNHLETGDTLTEKTSWYLAMAYLQVDDPENAAKILQTVVEDGGFKVEEAKILLKSLKQLASP